MENQVSVITLKQLKEAIARLENENHLKEETKIFLDTGWESIQEISPDALSVEEAVPFTVEDRSFSLKTHSCAIMTLDVLVVSFG